MRKEQPHTVAFFRGHILYKLFRMHKWGSTHTTNGVHLTHGTRIESRQEQKNFDNAMKELRREELVLVKKKGYATHKEALYLNPHKSGEIMNIIKWFKGKV